jgi:hypothetical protein
MIDLTYPAILSNFKNYIDPSRSESASFLIWYLENYYRLDDQDAVDAVCDQRGDKGVDGIYVSSTDETIIIFQTTISQKGNATIGDKSLREFAGTLTQFKDAASISNLVMAAGKQRLAALIKELDLESKIATHKVVGEFITNMEADQNGKDFLATAPNIRFIGKQTLEKTYISDARDVPIQKEAKFNVVGFNVTEYVVDAQTKALIAPVKATELVQLNGISDQSLFAFNVRGPLGKTSVNKDIVKSIDAKDRHRLFPLFHNGITVIAKSLEQSKEEIKINGYFVVNGCQSLSSFFDNSAKLTDDLRVLTKFIQVEPNSDLAGLVTEISNNQNGVKPRDFMANHSVQIRLQNEFRKDYTNQYFFEIKRGEKKDSGELITNEEAGLLLMAFDLEEPWATHRKYQIFDDKYTDLFAKKEVTADHIVLCHQLAQSVDAALPKLNNGLFAKYVLTRYMLVYFLRRILEKDELWKDIQQNPEKFVRTADLRTKFRKAIDNIVGDLIVDVNAEIEGLGADFDYRGKLRDSTWVKELAKTVVGDHVKLVARGKIASFKKDWESPSQAKAEVVQPLKTS